MKTSFESITLCLHTLSSSLIIIKDVSIDDDYFSDDVSNI